jgi:hypothetical protein
VVQPATRRKSSIVVPTTDGCEDPTAMSKRCPKSMHLYGCIRKINRQLPGSSVVHSGHTVAVPKSSFVKMWQIIKHIAAYESPFSPLSKVLLKVRWLLCVSPAFTFRTIYFTRRVLHMIVTKHRDCIPKQTN